MDKTVPFLLLDANMAIMNSQKAQFDELRAAGDLAAAMGQAVKTLKTALSVLQLLQEITQDKTT